MRTYKQRSKNIEQTVIREKKRRTHVRITAVISSALAFVVGVNLFLFVPYTTGGAPSLKAYKKSEYYSVIEKLAPLTYAAPVTKNNFDRWDLGGALKKTHWGASDGNTSTPPSSDMPNRVEGESYVEVTDNQVEGVTEGDLFKRSKDTLFYLSYEAPRVEVFEGEDGDYTKVDVPGSLVLSTYSIKKEDSALISKLEIFPEENFTFWKYFDEREMFLSPDLKEVTILNPCYDKRTNVTYTAIITVDTENVGTMSVKNVQYVAGSYVSSRMAGGVLLLVNNFTVYRNPDFSNEFTFLPSYGTKDDLKVLPVENIYLPENATRANFTVLATFDTQTGDLLDAEALLSFSNDVYVSTENIYVTNSFMGVIPFTYISTHDCETVVEERFHVTRTEITRIAYDGGMLEVAASNTVSGTINNRYAMDEFEGTFRVFTSVTNEPYIAPSGFGYKRTSSASLFVMDVENMNVLASAERFCPSGESVQSARFDGNTAYVCTAVVYQFTVCDPVYIFDLSDLENIDSKDTGEIAGFSSSLATFMNGTLLGIGHGDNWSWSDTLKIEIYAETENAVECVSDFQLRAAFSNDYKAYFIDRERGLVGLGILDYDGTLATEYLLLRFDGYALHEVTRIAIGSGVDDMRAFYEDGYLYVVEGNNLVVEYIG